MSALGVARAAETASLGFDTLEPLPPDTLRAFRQQGYKWIGRYLENLHTDEVHAIFDSGLGILPLSVARTGALSGAFGEMTGAELVDDARALGVPQGVHLTIDFEDTHGTVDQCDGYLRGASKHIVMGGYEAALYVAPPQPLSGSELFALPDVHIYWKGAGNVPEVFCGYSVQQGLPLEWVAPWAGPYKVDPDIIWHDRKGRTPVLWWPQ